DALTTPTPNPHSVSSAMVFGGVRLDGDAAGESSGGTSYVECGATLEVEALTVVPGGL
ncbi:MAG: hypothetical protein JOZ49_17525, partial [Mycolicibacterium sp.]|nr:hypothetical protein [Mycolicibacterium sp.]